VPRREREGKLAKNSNANPDFWCKILYYCQIYFGIYGRSANLFNQVVDKSNLVKQTLLFFPEEFGGHSLTSGAFRG
jgi:hypothetical protein